MDDGTKNAARAGAMLAFMAAASVGNAAERPELFRKLVECRSMVDPAQRLACYDAQVGALDVAEKKKDVVMMDREQVRDTRRSLFGFPLPNIGLFGGRKEVVEDVDEIEGAIATARSLPNGQWSLVLAGNAGTWETTVPLKFDPRSGQKINISKAAMGSYLASFGSNRGVRCRRVN